MGFIPTVEGSLRQILNEWLRDGNLWSLRARYDGTQAKDFTDACNRLGDDFIPAMQLRAVPELIWRTATVAHTLGTCPHQVDAHKWGLVRIRSMSSRATSLLRARFPPHSRACKSGVLMFITPSAATAGLLTIRLMPARA